MKRHYVMVTDDERQDELFEGELSDQDFKDTVAEFERYTRVLAFETKTILTVSYQTESIAN